MLVEERCTSARGRRRRTTRKSGRGGAERERDSKLDSQARRQPRPCRVLDPTRATRRPTPLGNQEGKRTRCAGPQQTRRRAPGLRAHTGHELARGLVRAVHRGPSVLDRAIAEHGKARARRVSKEERPGDRDRPPPFDHTLVARDGRRTVGRRHAVRLPRGFLCWCGLGRRARVPRCGTRGRGGRVRGEGATARRLLWSARRVAQAGGAGAGVLLEVLALLLEAEGGVGWDEVALSLSPRTNRCRPLEGGRARCFSRSSRTGNRSCSYSHSTHAHTATVLHRQTITGEPEIQTPPFDFLLERAQPGFRRLKVTAKPCHFPCSSSCVLCVGLSKNGTAAAARFVLRRRPFLPRARTRRVGSRASSAAFSTRSCALSPLARASCTSAPGVDAERFEVKLSMRAIVLRSRLLSRCSLAHCTAARCSSARSSRSNSARLVAVIAAPFIRQASPVRHSFTTFTPREVMLAARSFLLVSVGALLCASLYRIVDQSKRRRADARPLAATLATARTDPLHPPLHPGHLSHESSLHPSALSSRSLLHARQAILPGAGESAAAREAQAQRDAVSRLDGARRAVEAVGADVTRRAERVKRARGGARQQETVEEEGAAVVRPPPVSPVCEGRS